MSIYCTYLVGKFLMGISTPYSVPGQPKISTLSVYGATGRS